MPRGIKRTQQQTTSRIPSKPGDKIPQVHAWYLHEKFDYKKYAALKGKVTGYFRIYISGNQRSSSRSTDKYYKVHESGLMIFVDMEMFKIGIIQGVSVPAGFSSCTKRDFDKAIKSVLKLIL